MTTTLSLSTYTPNINDPRIAKRIKAVLEWCGPMLLHKKKPRSIHHSEIRKVFANTSKPLGRWLYANLLMQMGDYAPTHHSYCYALNEAGYERLRAMMGLSVATPREVAEKLYAPIIRGEVTPEYADKGGRRYHPIQNIRREDRLGIFSGWWDYDIDSCAATLVHQYARSYYRRSYPDVGEPFPAVAHLIEEKAKVRQHFATVAGVPLDQAKELSNSLFFLAPLTPHHRCSIFKILGEDRVRLERLKQDPYIKQLVKDLKVMWRYAIWSDQYERTMPIFKGKGRVPPMLNTAKRRQAIFVGLERKVMDAIHAWFGTEQFPGILMHDGFMSKQDVEVAALEAHVLEWTGYNIRLKKALLAKPE